MKKILISIVIFIILCLASCQYIYYGSLFRQCIYTEKQITIPQQFVDAKLVLLKKAYIAEGDDLTYKCLPELGKIQYQLVAPSTIENITIGKRYFEKNGQNVKALKVGEKEFTLKKVISVTKHGITTTVSGSGPLNYLILTDAQGKKYKILTVDLGINRDDRFLKMISSNSETILDSSYFRPFFD